MTGLTLDPDARSTATRALVALVLALAVAGATVAPVTAAATAQDGNGEIGIERTNDYLEVSLSEFGDDRPEEVTLEVTAGNESASTTGNSSDGSAEVAIAELADGIGHESLREAEVTVTAGDQTANETLDLRTVALANDVPVRIDGGDEPQLVLPLDQRDTVGITESDTVTVSAGGSETEADVRANGTQLAIDQSWLVGAVDPGDEIDLEASVGDWEPTERTLEPELRDIDTDLVLWHPLVETGSQYDVAAEDDGGNRYVNNSIAPARPGEIDLPSLSSATDVSVSLSAADGGNAFLEDETLSLAEPAPLSATVVGDGSTVAFEESVDGLTVSTVIVNESDGSLEQFALENGTVENGELGLDGTTVTADDELLVATDAGLARVTLSAPESGTNSDSAGAGGPLSLLIDIGKLLTPLLIPGLFGLAVGYGAYRFRDEWSRERLKLTGLIAVGPALAIAIILVVFLTGELTSTALSSFDKTIGLLPVEVAPWPHVISGFGVLLGAALAPVTYYFLGVPAGADRPTGFTVDVSVTDGEQSLGGRTEVYYRRANVDDPETESTMISSGEGRVTVPDRGPWEVVAKHDSHSSDVADVTKRSSSATLTVSFPATITLVDRDDGEPISGATITRDDGATDTTNASGRVSLEPGDDGSSVEVEITHEKYETRTETVSFTQNGDRTVKLAPRTGRVRLVSRVDGVRTPSMALQLSPREKVLDDRYGTVSMTTDRDGVATRDGLLIGQYRAAIGAPERRENLFEGGKTVLTVREDRSTKVEVDARFTWSLSSSHRDRIDQLRREVRALSDHSGRDTTIPRYYGSVVTAILETVESLPDAGHRFAHSEAEPDAVADALLSAAEAAIDAINDAMTTKRNVDLFAACADMPDPGVGWDGECDLETVLEWLEADAMSRRNTLKDRYENVTAQVETERESVSEAAPAEEMLRRAWELGSDAGRGDEAIVTIYTALLLLDAVEAVFERDPLRDRLSRTVF
ncbi:hypothetical protein [Natrinema versiforme]|uniref:Carboxypeptidase regulatory-like domain-containing protein n=1 Tax=Natrinema versiforme JCM 10478 TaxID=1227496 RepID=L9XVV4_9EURY|nr:hypothetical protein [Natrinema versiforme]ELY65900.1 hypothetical protein C489_13603 [Natrinema versiforme JCM 10478]